MFFWICVLCSFLLLQTQTDFFSVPPAVSSLVMIICFDCKGTCSELVSLYDHLMIGFSFVCIHLLLANGILESLEPTCDAGYIFRFSIISTALTYHLLHLRPCRMLEIEWAACRRWKYVDRHLKDYPAPSGQSDEPASLQRKQKP